jgi:hypothetical protein
MKITNGNHLILIRDIINEMEPNFLFKENIALCNERIAKIMETLIFSGNFDVANGIILEHKYKDKKMEEMWGDKLQFPV